MKMPLVSVVITSYNYAEYIEDAINSVQNQTYKNTEIIVIDDGSQDTTKEILEYYKDSEKIRIVSRENKGVIYTRNEGARLATGDFVMQLDADDTLDENYISHCMEKMTRENLDIVYTQAKVFGRVKYQTAFIDYNLEKLKHDNFIHAAALVRKSRLKQDPYDEYLDKLGNEDWDLFLDLCLDGARAGLLDEPLLHYRKHSDRKSRADSFEGLFNESLVRHHIWSKQNEKHPEQFSYFSSEIAMLYSFIQYHQDSSRISAENDHLKKRVRLQQQYIRSLERWNPVVQAKRVVRKLKGKA